MSISVFVVWTAVLLGGFLLTIATFVRVDRKRQQAADRELITLKGTIQQHDQALQRAELNSLRMVRYQIITARLAEALTIPEIVDIIINQGLGLLGAVGGAISLIDKETNVLEVVGSTGLDAILFDRWNKITVEASTLSAGCIKQQKPLWVNSLDQAEPEYAEALRSDTTHHAWCAIPLSIDGKIGGALVISFQLPQHFESDDQSFILTLAHKASLALERARLYVELGDQREDYRVTLDSIGDAVIATDAIGTVNFMNAVAQQLTGWRHNSGIGQPLANVFNIVSEDKHEIVESPFVRVMRGGDVVGLPPHTVLIARDGREIPIDDSGAPIRYATNAINGVVLVFRDITERRHHETELEVVLQRTQDLYETCHRIGIVYDANEVLRAQFNSRYLKHAKQACFIRFDSHWEETQPLNYSILACLEDGKATPGLADDFLIENSPLLRLFLPKSAIFIENIDSDPRVDPELRALLGEAGVSSLILYFLTTQQKCFGMLVAYFETPNHWSKQDYQHMETFIDQVSISLDNSHLLQEEKRARAEAEHANEARLRFLAMISHELRTPLASIKGFATTLLATDVTWDAEQQREFITIVNEEANKLTEMIEQLLDLSRLQAGTLRIRPEPQRLSHIIDSTQRQLELLTVNHQLKIDSATALPPVFVDKQRIAQVLLNLVGNATKYSPANTMITVSFIRVANAVQVSVSDQGPGIAPQYRKQVFAAFTQLPESFGDHKKNRGAGLGLAICKGLVEAHGGQIWIAENTGETSGAIISFTLPFAASPKNSMIPTAYNYAHEGR